MPAQTVFQKTARRSGILLPIFSLPSPYGIGTFGQEAKRFIDFLHESGQSYWQILPLGITGFGDSPYQNFSMYAGNPYFIDLDQLIDIHLIEADFVREFYWGDDPEMIDYGALYENRSKVLRAAYQRFRQSSSSQLQELKQAYAQFVAEEQEWLFNYACFMEIKNRLGGICWQDWPSLYRLYNKELLADFFSKNKTQCEYFYFEQFLFYQQWFELKQYALQKGIQMIGDLPIYIALDSVEVWSEPELFLLDQNLEPTFVAGCPPDYFSPAGQLWGNPLYNWATLKSQNYRWWVRRLTFNLRIFDLLRIDHFRGFEAYWAVPYGARTAIGGAWHKGPGADLFAELKRQIGELNLVAEDLGFLTDEVYALRDELGFPGMTVLEFAFDQTMESLYLPHNMGRNTIVYTGTHDNSTLLGWQRSAEPENVAFARLYFGVKSDDEAELAQAFMRSALTCVANTCILCFQDLLGLDDRARINEPGTAEKNWHWRFLPTDYAKLEAAKIFQMTKLSGRLKDVF